MNSAKLDNLKMMIINQYAMLEKTSNDKMIAKLNGLDFRSEFAKLRKSQKTNKIIYIGFILAALSLIGINIYLFKDSIKPGMFDLLQALFAFAFITIIFQRQYSIISLKIRLLGFLYEFYRK